MWHMERHHTTLSALAAGSGVTLDTIKKVRSRSTASTNAEAASKIAGFYGKSVAEFLRCEDGNNPYARVAALIDQLTPEEAALVMAQVQGILAARGK